MPEPHGTKRRQQHQEPAETSEYRNPQRPRDIGRYLLLCDGQNTMIETKTPHPEDHHQTHHPAQKPHPPHSDHLAHPRKVPKQNTAVGKSVKSHSTQANGHETTDPSPEKTRLDTGSLMTRTPLGIQHEPGSVETTTVWVKAQCLPPRSRTRHETTDSSPETTRLDTGSTPNGPDKARNRARTGRCQYHNGTGEWANNPRTNTAPSWSTAACPSRDKADAPRHTHLLPVKTEAPQTQKPHHKPAPQQQPAERDDTHHQPDADCYRPPPDHHHSHRR